jgi:hypothetical protein
MSTKIKGIAQEVIAKIASEGRVQVLSLKDTQSIDHLLAKGLAPIKEEFKRKERASRAYIIAQEEKLLIA